MESPLQNCQAPATQCCVTSSVVLPRRSCQKRANELLLTGGAKYFWPWNTA